MSLFSVLNFLIGEKRNSEIKWNTRIIEYPIFEFRIIRIYPFNIHHSSFDYSSIQISIQHSLINIRYSILLPEQLHDVIPVCKNQKAEKKHHSYDLGVLDKFITGFASENDFIKQEHYVPAVKGGYW